MTSAGIIQKSARDFLSARQLHYLQIALFTINGMTWNHMQPILVSFALALFVDRVHGVVIMEVCKFNFAPQTLCGPFSIFWGCGVSSFCLYGNSWLIYSIEATENFSAVVIVDYELCKLNI